MGLLLPQEISVKNTMVSVSSLPYRSAKKVKILCDYCGKEDFVLYRNVYKALYDSICSKLCCNDESCKKDKGSEVRRIIADAKFDFKSTQYRDKDWLYNEYIIKEKSAELLSAETGLGLRTMRKYINEYGLATKNGSKTNFITKEELEDLYISQRKTTIEIGDMYNLGDTTIGELLKKFNIPIFSQSEQMLRYYYVKGGIEKSIKYSNILENRIKSSCKAQGINRNDFTGFITSKNTRLRGGYQYKEWRVSVFKKDNYNCQCCGQHGGSLHAHHIDNFSNNADKRFDVSNGITMCFNCHSISVKGSFHNLYGTHNNNKEQLNEYIENKKPEVA